MTYSLALNTKNLASYINFNQLYNSYGVKEIVKRQCEYMRERPYSNQNKLLLPIVWIGGGGIVGFKVATKVADYYNLKQEKKTSHPSRGNCYRMCCQRLLIYLQK